MYDIKSVNDCFEQCKDMTGYIFAAFTDKIRCDKWPLDEDLQKEYTDDEPRLLEMRIFSEDTECKLFRGDIGRDFSFRKISETGNEVNAEPEDFFDELQYLDIDTKNEKMKLNGDTTTVFATGGGRYDLPITGNSLDFAVLKARHYIGRYPETGKAYICDWRCVGFYENEKAAGKVKCSWEGGE